MQKLPEKSELFTGGDLPCKTVDVIFRMHLKSCSLNLLIEYLNS